MGAGHVPLAETAQTIARFAPSLPIVTIPCDAGDADFAALAAALA